MSDAPVGRVVVCRVGTRRITVPVAAVREVVTAPGVIRIPGAAAAIRGVVNVRGGLVTVVSGAALLAEPESGASDYLLVLSMFDGRVAIEVDDVEDLFTTETAGRLPTLDVEGLVRPLFRPEAIKA
ncbi:MAG TPA: chemotaxis protein CheW [Gemmatimonadales bacterium]|nr:chemotaxis protein CheW [Gemmatimonadales bacterium]